MDKKTRSANSVGSEEKKFEMQAAAANCQIAVAEDKNMIEFLKNSQELKACDSSDLNDMFLNANNGIFGESKKPDATEEESRLDSKIPPPETLHSDGECMYS